MIVNQIYTSCLAQGTYYIENNGEAAIIDPLREIQAYLDMAALNGAKIKYIFETHFHADFVSGHVTLAKQTNAPIIYGPTANPAFDAHIAKDGEQFKIGNLTLELIHTPGHTLESSSYLLKDEDGKPHSLFSGDTLFLGDVGRPDLAQKGNDITEEDLAGMLFDSLRNKIMILPDDVLIYPAHGAGSSCGKNMMDATVDTLGNQKKMNYALRSDMTKEEFVEEVLEGLQAPPAYFPLNVQLNKSGYQHIDQVLEASLSPMSPSAFKKKAEETVDAIILDVRNQDDYVKSHIPNSIFVGLNGTFAPWVGSLLKDTEIPLLLVADEGKEKEAITRLSRVGFDNVLGYLNGGIEDWVVSGFDVESITSISAQQMSDQMKVGKIKIVDVRRGAEYNISHVHDAINIPLESIFDHIKDFPSDNFYLHCAGGYRSVIAASILKSKGVNTMINVEGGYDQISKLMDKLVENTCSL